MSDITFLGLGLMGSSLARALVRHGARVTVWNRTPEKAAPLAKAGAQVASDLVEALSASPIVVVCIDNYAATQALLAGEAAIKALAGRVVVQLSTGTPKEAAEMAAYMGGKQVRYLDGAILAGPHHIDANGGTILLCGDAQAHRIAGGFLAKLAADVRYIGANFSAASALDLAWLNIWYGSFVSVAHSARICHAEGADLAEFASLFPENPFVQNETAKIREDRFDRPTATLEVWKNALARLQQQAKDARISSAIPDFYASYFKKAMNAGLGQQEAIAIYKVV